MLPDHHEATAEASRCRTRLSGTRPGLLQRRRSPLADASFCLRIQREQHSTTIPKSTSTCCFPRICPIARARVMPDEASLSKRETIAGYPGPLTVIRAYSSPGAAFIDTGPSGLVNPMDLTGRFRPGRPPSTLKRRMLCAGITLRPEPVSGPRTRCDRRHTSGRSSHRACRPGSGGSSSKYSSGRYLAGWCS